jgi:hypothetical protein
MTATLTDCSVYRSLIVKGFTLEDMPGKSGQKTHFILEYDTDKRVCKVFSADDDDSDEPLFVNFLTNEDSFNYDIDMDRLILTTMLGRLPKMQLDVEDYEPDVDESPLYNALFTDDDDYNDNY